MGMCVCACVSTHAHARACAYVCVHMCLSCVKHRDRFIIHVISLGECACVGLAHALASVRESMCMRECV